MLLWNLLTDNTEKQPTNTPQSPIGIIVMVVLVVAVIGLFIWSTISNKKKQKKAAEMVTQLKIGDRVKTIGGICGFVAQINDAENTFVLETGLEENKSYIKFDKGAIYQTAPAQGAAVEAKEEKKATAKKETAEKKPAAKKTTTKKATKKVEE